MQILIISGLKIRLVREIKLNKNIISGYSEL